MSARAAERRHEASCGDGNTFCYPYDSRTLAFLKGARNDVLSVCVAASLTDFPELAAPAGACAADGFFVVAVDGSDGSLSLHGSRVPVLVNEDDYCTTGSVAFELALVGCELGTLGLSWQFDPATGPQLHRSLGH